MIFALVGCVDGLGGPDMPVDGLADAGRGPDARGSQHGEGPGGTESQEAAARCASVTTSACGGEITGAWVMTARCFATAEGGHSSDAIDGCGIRRSDHLDESNITVVRTFHADGTYELRTTGSRVSTVELPKECTPTPNCQQLRYGDELLRPVEDTGDSCTLIARKSLDFTSTGTWSIVGSQIALDVDMSIEVLPDGSERTFDPYTTDADYCVDGDQLTLSYGDARPGTLSWAQMTRMD
ncbi:MAG: hypothetical protein PVI30_22700 [Myxococcales bacterium]|jgi:hypothetical protein